MYKRTLIIILMGLAFPILAKSQSSEIETFTRFVNKNYKVPEELKYNCIWTYAVVSVKTNVQNKIVSYNFVAQSPDTIKKTFNFLLGYQFSKNMKINGHPIVFYLLVDNSNSCNPKPGDLIYHPNDIINQVIYTLGEIKKGDPKTIFIASPIYVTLYPLQQKK